jgi:hypothetical protein
MAGSLGGQVHKRKADKRNAEQNGYHLQQACSDIAQHVYLTPTIMNWGDEA